MDVDISQCHSLGNDWSLALQRTLSHRGANMSGRKLFHFGGAGERKNVSKSSVWHSPRAADGLIKV